MLSLRSRLLVSHGYLVALLFVALMAGMLSLRWVVEDLDEAVRDEFEVLDAPGQGPDPTALETPASPPNQHENLWHAAREARSRARTATLLLGLLMVIGLLSYLVVSRMLQKLLLGRMRSLVDVADAVAAGDRMRRADVRIEDELGRLARFVNQALDHEQKISALAEGRLAEQRELLVALVRRLDHPTTVVGMDGSIIASTMSPEEQSALEELTPEIRRAAKVLLERKFLQAEQLSTEIIERSTGRAFSIRALVGGPRRVVGWLATSTARALKEEG